MQPAPKLHIVVIAADAAAVEKAPGYVTLLQATPGAWAQSGLLFIHFCSGPRRPGDLCAAVEASALDAGILIKGWSYDPLVSPACDLVRPDAVREFEDVVSTRRVAGSFGGPPCSTVSRARHRRLPGGGGPRPLRSRARPFLPLPHHTNKERIACLLGTHLFLIVLRLLMLVHNTGGWYGLEHPADPGCEPFSSFWHSAEMRFFLEWSGGTLCHLHQCRFGAPSVKPTTIASNDPGFEALACRCKHAGGHA